MFVDSERLPTGFKVGYPKYTLGRFYYMQFEKKF